MLRNEDNIFKDISFRDDKYLLFFTIFSTISSGLIPAITSILTGRVFDLLTNVEIGKIPHGLTSRSMAIMALGAASFPIIWLLISSWMFLGEKLGFRIRDNVLDSYMEKSFSWYDQQSESLGNFTQLNRCIEEVRQSTSEAAAITLQSFVTILALIGTSFYYSWSLTLVILCSAPIILVVALIFSRLIKKYSDLENDETTTAAQLLTWSMNANQFIKLNNSQDIEISKFNQSVSKCNSLFIKACLYTSLNSSIIRLLTLCMFVQGFWFGSTMVRKGKLATGDVITCFHSCLMLGSTLSEVFHQIVILQKGDVARKKISSFLNEKNDETSLESSSKVPIHHHKHNMLNLSDSYSISFENIIFSYPNRRNDKILNKLSLKFPSHQLSFIIGKSGSGKSTLSKLLLKLYTDYEGTIKINDTDIKEISQDWIISNTTVVEQRCTLFNDTLRNNILLGSKEYHEGGDKDLDSKLKQACTFALLNHVILDLPEGLDTLVGNNGVSLSGGQCQRVALARAFMRDTPILILDEAVSALDVTHRQLLMEAIRVWRENKTTIVLTHELNQIKAEDNVFVVNSGEIVEHGRQEDLMHNSTSTFYRFYNLQEKDPKGKIHEKEKDSTHISIGNIEPSDIDSFLSKSIISDLDTPIIEEEEKKSQWMDVESGIVSLQETRYSHRLNSKHSRIPVTADVKKESIDSSKVDCEKAYKINEKKMTLTEIIKRMFTNSQKTWLLYVGLLSSVLAGAANPIFSFTFSYLLNGIVPSSNGSGSSYYLLKWSFIVLGVSVGDGIFNMSKAFILGYCSEIWIMDLRKYAMDVITNNQCGWFQLGENKSSEMSALLLNDLRDLRNLVTEFLGTMTTFVVVSLFGLIWALVSGWKLSLVCISMFPLIVIFSGIYGAVLQKCENDYKSAIAELENSLYESVTGMRTIKYLRLQNHFRKRHLDHKNKVKLIAKKRSVVTGIGMSITYTLTLCIQAILFYYGLKLVFVGEYSTMKMFETFTLLLFTIMTCTNLINQIPEIARGQRAAMWVYRVIDEREETREFIPEYSRFSNISNTSNTTNLIEIKNLTFRYPKSTKNVFKNMNVNLLSNQTIALVGESGCGKSTLISLLAGFSEVKSGTIYVDGTDITDWNIKALRNQISVVEQTSVLFDGTIRENLLYSAKCAVSEVDIISVLKHVQIYDFITNLPDGLETKIDTDLLSGGQAQRLCIARALLKDYKILILDECTSALDAESSCVINDLVARGMPGKLVIVITHSRQMMQSCNNIFVLKDGDVVENGEFKELIEQNGELSRILANLGG